jgi:hypothetical protein
MDGNDLFPTIEGSPQGGVASPLIANVALHGLETAVSEAHPKAKIIRYADDLVVLHPERKVIKAAQETVSAWLANMGLELKPSKTKITHTLNDHEGTHIHSMTMKVASASISSGFTSGSIGWEKRTLARQADDTPNCLATRPLFSPVKRPYSDITRNSKA